MIINEVEEAENIIQTNKYEKFSSALSLLIRYYIHIKGLKKNDVKDEIKKFLVINHEDYNYWEKFIDKVIRKSKHNHLCQIDKIPITQKEIDIIYQVDSEKKQKILFTFLVIGKLKWLKTGKAWVNNTGSSTFKIANAETNAAERDYIIRDFHDAGYISYARSPMNMSIHIDFIDDTDEPVITIKDLRCLGYRWLQYKTQKYAECNRCGILFKTSKTNKCYCQRCRKYKIIKCISCGKEFETPIKTHDTECRCYECRIKHRRDYQAKLMEQRRSEIIC